MIVQREHEPEGIPEGRKHLFAILGVHLAVVLDSSAAAEDPGHQAI